MATVLITLTRHTPNGKQLRAGKLYSGSSVMGEGRGGGERGDWYHCVCSQEAETDEGGRPVCFLLG